jgi:hypothetical protein
MIYFCLPNSTKMNEEDYEDDVDMFYKPKYQPKYSDSLEDE